MPDGSITISTALDNRELEKQLEQAKRKIASLEDQIAMKKNQRMALLDQAEMLGVKLDVAKAKLYQLQTSGAAQPIIQQQTEAVAGMQTQWDQLMNSADKYERDISSATVELDRQKTKAGGLVQELAAAGSGSNRMAEATERAKESMDRFKSRLAAVVRSALIFTVITKALASLRDWMGKVIKANPEAAAAIAKLKGALLTLAQPLVEIIIPAFIGFVNVLSLIVNKLAQVFSAMFGTTAEQSRAAAKSLNAETSALDETGAAAKKASKSLAAFDEINMLSGSDSGSAGAAASTSPDFSYGNEMDGKLKGILETVAAIGAAFLTWKIASMFTEDLSIVGGLAMAVGGAILLVTGYLDAWENGLDFTNIIEMFSGLALVAGGLALAFGSVAAGIALIVGGLAFLVLGIKDVIENGFTLENTLIIVGGIIATGLGIALLVGSWIPLLIAAVAAALLAITVAMGHGDDLINGAKEILKGFADFFIGIFTGDIAKAIQGIGEIFNGLRTIAETVLNSLETLLLSFFSWLDEKTGGHIHGLIETFKSIFVNAIEWTKDTLFGMLEALKEILTGIITFLSGVFSGNWDKAWQGIKDIFTGTINGMITILESFINFFVRALNVVIDSINALSFDVPDWVPGIGGSTVGFDIPRIPLTKIPRLATGAVIPPNREFMAVLGDQKSGNNIEVPEALLRKIYREEGSGEMTLNETIVLDGEVVYKNQKKVSRRHGPALVT